jgi:hypothetical protein
MKASLKLMLSGLMITLASMPPQALGQSWLSDNKTCFCLKHKTTDQVLKNCTGAKLGQNSYITATCKGSEARDPQAIVEIRPPWTPIRDGAHGCAPYEPKPRETDEVPRRPD